MSYIKAEQVLPDEIVKIIQQYVDGTSVYIPRKDRKRQDWGNNTGIREELGERNKKIYKEYCEGRSTKQLAECYCLSIKSIQRIIRDKK